MALTTSRFGNICFIILMSLLFIPSNGEVKKCVSGFDTEGYTLPQGDIVIEYGNSLEILCILNNPKNDTSTNASADMEFLINGLRSPNDKVTIVNSTVIRFYDPKPEKSTDTYTCSHNKAAVCMNKVAVAVKPQNITDFKCIGYNLDNLTCTWTAPNNEIKTEYRLKYLFKGRATINHTCPKLTYEKNNSTYSCFWNLETDPQYRPAQSWYYFTLHMNNSLGENIMKHQFNHYANILPDRPQNLSIVNVTTNSVYLNWSLPDEMTALQIGFQHRLLYQCVNGPKEWKLAGIINNITNKYITYNITGIPHAHSLCDIRVSIRTALAESEEMWSQNTSVNVRTLSTYPGAAPKTDTGSFEEKVLPGNTREVIIYWLQIPEVLKNGEDFGYEISTFGNYNQHVTLMETNLYYAKYKNLDLNKHYNFKIWSKNAIGNSTDYSYIYIPGRKINEPKSFVKMSFGLGKYKLSWNKPKSDGPYYYTNYTIFWCLDSKELPYQCKGHLNWTVVSVNTTEYNISLDESQSPQFAISANSNIGSSGMIWATCTLTHNQSIGKMKTVWINNVGSNFIEVGWKLDCSDRIMSVDGFIIYYCPVLSLREKSCIEPEKNFTIKGDSTLVHGRLEYLRPYTTYRLKVAVISKHLSYSQPSDPLFNTTLEAAPSAPINLNIIDVSNTSITIVWQKPNTTNGVIKYYMIEYNNRSEKIIPGSTAKIQYEIKELNSYENYNISVKACTIFCTESTTISKRTDGGRPDAPEQPTVKFQNASLIAVEWQKPKVSRGKIDFYYVQVKERLSSQNSTRIENLTDTKYIIRDCGDSDKYESFYISVKAVNVFNGIPLDSNWSPELEYYCHTPTKYMYWILLFFLLLFLMLGFYASKRAYKCCKEMRNVDIKLPPGLAPDINESNWIQKGQDEISHNSPRDEEYLLLKLNGMSSGDSSGCSSGHESVSSSLESGKNSSSSDSGTEQPRTAVSTDDLRQSSLNLHNALLKPSPTKRYNTMPIDNYASGNYCVLGVNPAESKEKVYSPINLSPENTMLPYHVEGIAAKSTPYVLTCDLTKPNSILPKLLENSPAYVMAGYNVENKPMYIENSDCSKDTKNNATGKLSWSPNNYDSVIDKGYVSVGDIPTQVKANSGYVPHRPSDTTLKEK